MTATAKVQKKIIRDFVTGSGRSKVEGWLPHYMAFPFKAYTKGGGGRLGPASLLAWRGGSGWAAVVDIRGDALRIFDLEGLPLQVFEACAEVTTVRKLAARLADCSHAELCRALEDLTSDGLLFRDGPQYVRTAVHAP